MANFGHFHNANIFRILGVFGGGFLHTNNPKVVLQAFFAPFWHLEFLTQTDPLFFQILGVFWSGFLHTTTLMWSYNSFSHLFGIFNF